MQAESFTEKLSRRINPILIKEVRQGVRSTAYTIIFITIQVVMLFYLLFGMVISMESGSSGSEMDATFWVLVSLFLLICLPLMGANALSNESRNARLELLLLTRLTSRRIVYGKWFAIIAQGFLLVMALLPYLILRYYIGSVEFHESLLQAVVLLLESAIITGVAVCVSVIKSPVVRWLIIGFGAFFLLPYLLIGNAVLMGSGLMDDALIDMPLLLLSGCLLVAICIEMAAARFNVIEENHDTAKRLILWVMLLIALLATAVSASEIKPLPVFAIAFALVVWDGLCRPAMTSPTVYEPFVRRGWLGRLAGRVLYPGWLPACAFSVLTLALLAIWLYSGTEKPDARDLWSIVLVIGAFALPFALLLLLPISRLYGLYMCLFQFLVVLVTVLLYGLSEVSSSDFTLLVCWIPTAALQMEFIDNVLTRHGDNPLASVHMVASLVTTALAVLVIAIKAIPQRRLMLRMEQKALQNIRERAAHPSGQEAGTPNSGGQH